MPSSTIQTAITTYSNLLHCAAGEGDGQSFGGGQFPLLVTDGSKTEIMWVVSRKGDYFTVQRQAPGTAIPFATPHSFAAGASISTLTAESVVNPPTVLAGDITYDPTASGLSSTNVQDVVDELADPANVPYSNSVSGLVSADVKDAIDELAVGETHLRYIKVRVTNAQIKNLPLTPVVLVAAPGAGKMIVVNNALVKSGVGVDYTGLGVNDSVSIISLTYGDTAEIATLNQASSAFVNKPAATDGDLLVYHLVQKLLKAGIGTLYPLIPVAYVSEDGYVITYFLGATDNVALSVWMNTLADEAAALGGGDVSNYLDFHIWYTIVTV